MAVKDLDSLVELIVERMGSQAEEAGTSRAEVDISGGIDSATVAALSVRAFGEDKVIGVYTSVNSTDSSRRLARLVAEAFRFPLVELELSAIYEQVVSSVAAEFERLDLPFPDPGDLAHRTVFGGLRSCLRAPVGRFVNRAFGGGIRQGTGNRDEDELLRFYQKGGDGEVDCNWIAGLFKSEVWELASHLGVPEEVIRAEPTPDLWGTGSAHTDEDELEELTGVPLTYTRPGGPTGTIEWVSRENARNGCITGTAAQTPPADLGYGAQQARVIMAVRRMERITRHKAEPPPHLSRSALIAAGVVD
ncbi:NAD(+) synthase [Planctomycetota bacterium]